MSTTRDVSPKTKKGRGRPPKDKVAERLDSQTKVILGTDGAVGGGSSSASELCKKCNKDLIHTYSYVSKTLSLFLILKLRLHTFYLFLQEK